LWIGSRGSQRERESCSFGKNEKPGRCGDRAKDNRVWKKPASYHFAECRAHTQSRAKSTLCANREAIGCGILALVRPCGIGDSGNRTDNLSLKDGVISDVKDAMNFLSVKEGIHEFILMGICSGADNSLRVAQTDARVIGAVPIEAYYFATPGYHWYTYRKRLLNPKSWCRLVTMKADFWRILKKYKIREKNSLPVNGRSEGVGVEGSWSFKNEIVSEIQDLLNRGVSLYFIYCVDSPSYYNHYLQLRHKAASWEKFSVKLFPDTDHTLPC
jgi:hypothetical protein